MKAYLTQGVSTRESQPQHPPKTERSKKSIYKEKKSSYFLCRIEIIFYFCSVKNDNDQIGLWCNGNTTDSGPVIPGSNPGGPTKRPPEREVFFLSMQLIMAVCLRHQPCTHTSKYASLHDKDYPQQWYQRVYRV